MIILEAIDAIIGTPSKSLASLINPQALEVGSCFFLFHFVIFLALHVKTM